MSTELEEARGQLFIGGDWRDAASGETLRVVDPSTGRPFGRVAVAGPDDARAAVDAAADAEDRWAAVPGHERARLLRELARRIAADREEFARLIAREVGKPIAEARTEADRASGVFGLAAEEIRQLTGTSYPADSYTYPTGNEHRILFTMRDPVGVVVAISPFNFPLNLLSHKLAPALAAGNPIVAKPTGSAPLTALRLARHAEAAGFPRGVWNVVLGPGGTVGDTLIEHPRTRLITFTGSTSVGKQIAERAGRHAKRVLLEMGGLDPLIVLPDAPLEIAVKDALRGAFGYAGQVCTASKRLLVAESVAEPFVRAFGERASRLRVGPALDETTEVGPVIDAPALDRLDSFVQDARHREALLITGGSRLSSSDGGFFYCPTVLDRVDPASLVAREEPFGPVVPIIHCADDEEIVRIANGTEYGLQASVYTRDLTRAFRLVRRIRAGAVHVNDPTNLRWDALPFGGVKESGIGREGLRSAMEEMTDVKLVTVNYGG